ncbi:S41 family peptidase [Fusibacter sp. 3D3]|uniref:S41 family peptidase n=1 Tax=Fusibacter sp. 3D3 TaxID=1048380 RepID=UPI000853C673|nr:S41 family peptidase [Fusibacter sp. 3D3]GAU77798.1 carboxyl-terminal protease [Fusibacter sp. 3D3]
MKGKENRIKTTQSNKRNKKHERQMLFKKILVILLVLLLVGTAIAPVFSQTDNNVTLLANTVNVNVGSDGEVKIDESVSYYKNFVEFMVDFAKDNYYKDVDKQILIEGAYRGIFESLDPHSNYFTPEEYSEFSTDMEGEFSGIGATITDGDEYVEIVSPIKNTPAYRAGLLPNDKIATIDGEDAKGWTKEKAVVKIRGEKGTKVTLGIIRGNHSEILPFEIIRDIIVVNTVNFELLENNIGYIEITQFGEKTNAEFDAAIKYMQENKVDKLIVDVRNNPGGFLHSAIHISDYFVDKGKEIVKVDYRGKTDEVFRAEREKLPMTLAVLVNGGSASASEIFSGTVQQNKTGTVIGSLTYGKGTVQNLVPLTNGGGIKLTVAEYLTPNNTHVDKKGITPDLEIRGVDNIVRAQYLEFVPMSEKVYRYRGEIGLNVYGAQQRLKMLGYDVSVDGQFGEQTEKAIRAYQAEHHLTVNGVLTLKTVDSIEVKTAAYIKGEYDLQLNRAIELLKLN